MWVSRFHCLADRCSAAVSSSRRFTQTGSATVPRWPNRSRVTRCRTSVIIWLASATTCHLSTAIWASDRAARIPEAYGADGSITTILIIFRKASDCSPSQSRTHAPVRPGANPSSDPGPSREQSTKLVSHGSDRFQVIPSKIQRTEPNRVSSIPNRLVGGGSGNHFVAATTSALCAVGQDTSYSPATSETARLPDAIALATCSRSRSVTRARGRTAAETWVNVLRGHSASPQVRRRFRHHSSTVCPEVGRSFSRITDRSFTVPLNTPHSGHGPSRAACSMITFTVVASTRRTSRTLNSCSRPNNTDVASDMLVAPLLDVVRDQQHVGATSPSPATTRASPHPLKFEEPLYPHGTSSITPRFRLDLLGDAVPSLTNHNRRTFPGEVI